MNTTNHEEIKQHRNFLKQAVMATVGTMFFSKLLHANENSSFLSTQNAANEFRILFQGDSITDGNRGRDNDLNHIMGHGYAFSIASRLEADYPDKNLHFYNRGISANKITDLAARWQTDTLDIRPDLLSILIGVNDAGSIFNKKDTISLEKYETVYKSLLDQVKAMNPEIIFVLNQPFTLPVGNFKDYWEAWHQEIVERQNIVERIAKSYDAIFVRHQDAFDAACKRAPADYWIWDGVHPTVAGHELMAREWINQVKKQLTFIK